MADTIPMLRREQRRRLLMNGWLIAGFVIVGTAVTNERGIFRPVGMDGVSATARAFIAMAAPVAPSRLRDVRSVSGLNPFNVAGPTSNVRRRLIDAIDWEPGDGEGVTQTPLSFGAPAIPSAFNVADASNDAPAGAAPPAIQNPAFVVPPDAVADPPAAPGLDTGVVPEPATWAMLILGFGIVGSLLRTVNARRLAQGKPPARRRRKSPAA